MDALYPTGGLGGAAPPPIIAALAVQGVSAKKVARAGQTTMFQEGDPWSFDHVPKPFLFSRPNIFFIFDYIQNIFDTDLNTGLDVFR